MSGKRRDMGLGGYPDVTLAGAKEAARISRVKIKAGVDPIQEALDARSKTAADNATKQTFKQCAEAYFAFKETEWLNVKHAGLWRTTLSTYAFPVIGELIVSDVKQSHIMAILNTYG